jgi:phosphoribosyl 1,2-cyclic phosphate phosphodiesterase
MDKLNGIGIGYGALLDYYEKMGLARRKLITEPFTAGGVVITAVPVGDDKSVSVFVFEKNGRKAVYAPCDCKPFPINEHTRGADVLIVGNTFVGDILKGGRFIGGAHPLRAELHSMDEVLDIGRRSLAANIIITHIEEGWGKSYDDYTALETQYPGVKFAYDGMEITI